MATKKLPTVAESHRERMAARLVLYRDYVARVARGEAISAEDADLVHKAMDTLGLPSFAFQRDVRAWVVAARANQQQRLELQWNHPQLFTDVDEWVRGRVRAVALRGEQLCRR